jgi:signal transduction histidine kinase
MSDNHDEQPTSSNFNPQLFLPSIFSIIYDARRYSIVAGGFAEILQRELAGPLNDDQKEMVYELLRRAAMTSHVLEQGVMLLSLDVYPRKPEPTILEVSKPIQDAIAYAINRSRNRVKQAPILVNQVTESHFIYADAEDVVHLLVQLLDNAIKYTPSTGRITIGTSVSEGMIAISIQDTGAGILLEKQSYLFQRLSHYYLNLPGELSGPGVGLAIAQSLAQRNHGDIFLTESSSNGSTFTVTLPQSQNIM